MYRTTIALLLLVLTACKAKPQYDSAIEFTADLEHFDNLMDWKEHLKGVEVLALGENTHGLGAVFSAKAELVQFLHEELDFDMVLFESGYGDAALAWEQRNTLSSEEFVRAFSSNFYYQSEEVAALLEYAKSKNGDLVLQGFDCQPQQNFLTHQMAEVIEHVDPEFADSVAFEMGSFNQLYQYENNADTVAFYAQRDRFISFLSRYRDVLATSQEALLEAGVSQNVLNILEQTTQFFTDTYSKMEMGEMMGWPAYANLRDRAMLAKVKWFKEQHPNSKIIVWAQNSHIENQSKPGQSVNWMGHGLKEYFGTKYYSVGTVVYSGTDLNYNGSLDFEHKAPEYLAYRLNQFQKEVFVINLRTCSENDFTAELLLGMESNGSTAEFVAQDRFDGLLFLQHSDIPTLMKKE